MNNSIDSRWIVSSVNSRSGADPSELFNVLEGVIARQDWLNYVDRNGQAIGSFRRYIELPFPDGCGIPAKKLAQLLELQHRYENDSDIKARMATLRENVRKLMGEEVPAVRPNGRPSNQNFDISKFQGETKTIGGTSAEYTLSLLKRDAPDLAEMVINGEISAAEGKRQLQERKTGLRVERVMLNNVHDLHAVAKKLAHYLDASELEALIDALREQVS